jgi:nickel/cobalt transporter (NicO) family protein
MDKLFLIQQWIRDALASEFSNYAATRDLSLIAAMFPLGIFFGAVHALTPGHSKAVLASYILGSRLSAFRGVAVSSMLAFVHVFSAVILALTAAFLINRTLGGAGRAPALEILSRGLLGVIGVWLLARAFRHRPHAHNEGLVVGAIAGLIPCPLTLFAMFLSLSYGIPEAGLVFAGAMMIGVAITLSVVAIGTVLARNRVLDFVQQRGASVERVLRLLDAITGILLILIGIRQAVA